MKCQQSCHNLVSPNYLSQSASKLPRRSFIVILWSCLSKNSHPDNNFCTFFFTVCVLLWKLNGKQSTCVWKIFCTLTYLLFLTHIICARNSWSTCIFDSPSFWFQTRIFSNYIIKFFLCRTENFSTKSDWNLNIFL